MHLVYFIVAKCNVLKCSVLQCTIVQWNEVLLAVLYWYPTVPSRIPCMCGGLYISVTCHTAATSVTATRGRKATECNSPPPGSWLLAPGSWLLAPLISLGLHQWETIFGSEGKSCFWLNSVELAGREAAANSWPRVQCSDVSGKFRRKTKTSCFDARLAGAASVEVSWLRGGGSTNILKTTCFAGDSTRHRTPSPDRV